MEGFGKKPQTNKPYNLTFKVEPSLMSILGPPDFMQF